MQKKQKIIFQKKIKKTQKCKKKQGVYINLKKYVWNKDRK